VVFDPTGYRDDNYTIVGGTQTDTLRMLGGAFRTIEVVPGTSSRTIVATTENNNAIVIESTNVEEAVAEVTAVHSVDVYLPAGVTSVIVEDASVSDTGMMKVRSAAGEFLPFVFTNPTQSIKIVTTNPSITIQELSRDPLFLGAVSLSMRDFGDAPATFPTTVASRAASHEAIGPRLGALRDVELDGQPSATANGDGSDDDGVMFGAIVPSSPAGININLQNATQGKVDAWIDFNADGVWETSEKVLDSVSLVSGLQTLNYTVPAAVAGVVVARIRVSTVGGLSPNGYASDGEVEDYAVTIGPRVATPTAAVSGNATSRSELSRIQVQFDSIVNAVPSDFVLRNTTTNKIVTGMNVALDNSTGSTRATLTFTNGESILTSSHASIPPSLANGSYELLYRPVSLSSSADAVAVDSFFRKYGDSNGDNLVSLIDFAAFRASFGKTYDSNNLNNGYRSDLDSDRNGVINLLDFAAFRSVFGT
jgi:GEVED domain